MTSDKPNKPLAIIALALMLSISYPVITRSRGMTPPAAAQDKDVHTIEAAGLQFELPKGWKAETQSNGNIFLTFEDGAGNVTFVVDDLYNVVVDGMKTGMKEKLTDLKFDNAPKEDTLNGIAHINESGSGQMQGVKIIWSIDVLKTKAVTILTFGIDHVLKAHLAEYRRFVDSIKKI